MKRNSRSVGRFALSSVALAATILAAGGANALGLGRLSVHSGLGESLKAEIDITSLSPEEAANFQARVASPDAYRAAGVEYNSALPGARISLERRPDGRPYLRISSDRAIQEPFVDVILELSWSSGRLVREYTLLLDPVNDTRHAAAPAAAPVFSATAPGSAAAARSNGQAAASPSATPVAPAPRPAVAERAGASTQRAAAAPAERKPSTTERQTATPKADVAAAAPGPAVEGAEEYRVRRGDTLSGIANRFSRQGVSLDQMLVALYRTNPQAFNGDNMNRLKSGVVIAVPSNEQAQATSPGEARQVIQAQSADFAAYRQRLAGHVPKVGADEPSRQASGKVEAAVEDRKQAPRATPDRLTLSKGAAVAAKGAVPEDHIAKEREKQDASARVAELSKNVEDLKKISPTTSGTGSPAPATGGQPAGGLDVPAKVAVMPNPSTPAPAAAASSPAVPALPAAVALPAATGASVADAQASAPVTAATNPELLAANDSASAPAADTQASAPAPAASAPMAAAMPVPAQTAGAFDTVLESPLTLPLAGGLVALLAGFGFYRLRSRAKKDSGETSFLESRLQPDSFFGASGGQRIDTKDASGTPSSLSYSLSQLDAIGDVDPVAEADVYLAYGRDLQAEEILKEAMRANPERLAIRTKLLEVYAKRRDAKGFELLATQLFGLTGGQGEDWAKCQELGRQIDSENILYLPGGAPANASKVPEGGFEPLGASTMPQSVMPTPSKYEDPAARGLDLDLDLPLDSKPAFVADPRSHEASRCLCCCGEDPRHRHVFRAASDSRGFHAGAGCAVGLPFSRVRS